MTIIVATSTLDHLYCVYRHSNRCIHTTMLYQSFHLFSHFSDPSHLLTNYSLPFWPSSPNFLCVLFSSLFLALSPFFLGETAPFLSFIALSRVGPPLFGCCHAFWSRAAPSGLQPPLFVWGCPSRNKVAPSKVQPPLVLKHNEFPTTLNK